jgi:hypothetical protein
MATNTAAEVAGLAVSATASGNYLLAAAAQIMITQRFRYWRQFNNLPAVCTHPWSVCTKPPLPQGCWSVRNPAAWQLPGCFGGADNEANNTVKWLLLAVSIILPVALIRGLWFREAFTNTAAGSWLACPQPASAAITWLFFWRRR